jgi:hypothetical protein
MLSSLAYEAAGAAKHPAFPAPSVFGRPLSSKTRVHSRRENAMGCVLGCLQKIAMSVAFQMAAGWQLHSDEIRFDRNGDGGVLPPHATGVYPGCASIVAQVGQARLACGGGLGRGVSNKHSARDTPTPDPSERALLVSTPQGGGEEKERADSIQSKLILLYCRAKKVRGLAVSLSALTVSIRLLRG